MEQQTICFTLSTEAVNSYGFLVRTSGIELSAFKNNPIMLWNHDSNQPIGTWTNIRLEGTKLLADTVFDTEDKTAQEVSGKVARSVIKACSVGILPLNIEKKKDT